MKQPEGSVNKGEEHLLCRMIQQEHLRVEAIFTVLEHHTGRRWDFDSQAMVHASRKQL